ncbi:MAG: class I adenylate-forming enzyme family protein [Gammaproteobacteria bacterium]|nr:class I adenylate-forming enzyme family protein [Gammaproteobacteria bacterium]
MKAPHSRTLYDLLDEQANRYPDRLAAIHDDRSATYSELDRRSRVVAAALKARGICAGDRVALLLHNSIEWLEVCFGISALGAVVVPISTWSKAAELEFLLDDSKAVFLVTLDSLGSQDFARDLCQLIPELEQKESPESLTCERFPTLRGIAILGDSKPSGVTAYESFINVEPLDPVPPPGARGRAVDDAIVLYTSGSSSRPKAVRMMHYATIENGFNIGERQGLQPDDRVHVSPPLFWAYGAANAMPATLTHGATLVLQTRFEPGVALDLIERHGCTAIYTLPVMTNALIENDAFAPERTRTLRTGLTIGGPQDVKKAAEVLGASEICNVYGASETYGNCCVTEHAWPLDERAHCQGEPLPGVTVRIVDPETGKPVDAGEDGLVEVRGYLMAGYGGASASQNESVFTPDGFYRTGDIGHLDRLGRFVFVGRDTEMIKRAGINVSPVEIEEVLLQHPKVAQSSVVGVPEERRGEVIVAFVVPKQGESVSAQVLDAHCSALMSRYKVPDRFIVRKSLPLTTTGKVMRRELLDEAKAIVSGDK